MKTIKEFNAGNVAGEIVDFDGMAGGMPRYSLFYIQSFKCKCKHFETVEEAENFLQNLLDNQAK